MFERILTVCTGNICRSPLAEALLRTRSADRGSPRVVRSAGLGALHGHPADPTTAQVAASMGVEIGDHRATQVRRDHTRWADLILAMERHHLDGILELDPTARGKAFLLGHWFDREIPDPYRREEAFHRMVYQQTSEAVDSWLDRI